MFVRKHIFVTLISCLYAFMTLLGATQCKPDLPIDKDKVFSHVTELAVNIGQRYTIDWSGGPLTGNLMARDYIRDRFTEYGLEDVQLQTFKNDCIADQEYHDNVMGRITGSTHPEKIIIVGAHFDTPDRISPEIDADLDGAVDNATGIASMLEIAKYFSNNRPSYTIQFVAFNCEETFFGGSEYYHDYTKNNGDFENTLMMLNLDVTQNNYTLKMAPTVYFIMSPNKAALNSYFKVKNDMGVCSVNYHFITPEAAITALDIYTQTKDYCTLFSDVKQWKDDNVIVVWPWAFGINGDKGTIKNVDAFALSLNTSFILNFLKEINNKTPEELAYKNR